MTTSPAEPRRANPTRAYRLAALLLGVGTLHFVVPKQFDEIVPRELPGSQRFYTYASGVAELTTGALLLGRRTRRMGGLAAMAVFLGVYPANINMCRLWKDKPLFMRIGAYARLPMQIPMITEAFKVYRTS